jgi:glycerol-3-phosphate dehydrogenase
MIKREMGGMDTAVLMGANVANEGARARATAGRPVWRPRLRTL